MECLTCELTSICKIYEFVSLQKATADISVGSCRAKRSGAAVNMEPPIQETSPANVGIFRRSAEAIASVADRIRSLSTPQEEVLTLRRCDECREESSASDFAGCASCGKEQCKGCLVHDTKTSALYCEECWDKL